MKRGRKEKKVDKETGEVISPAIAKAVAVANDKYFDENVSPGQEALIKQEEKHLPPREARDYEYTAVIKIKAAVEGAQTYSIPITPSAFVTPGFAVVDALSAAVRGSVFRRAIEGIAGEQGE